MGRARFQVLIIPYRMEGNGVPEYAVTRRSDMDAWQFLSGGGEGDETAMQAAKREANEEGGVPYDCDMLMLDSIASIPARHFAAHKVWGEDVYVVPEYCFGVNMRKRDLKLSFEHTEMRWTEYDAATTLLTWDSNKTALWELKERLTRRSSN